MNSRHRLIAERELKGAADLQDKQDKLTATTAKIRKDELRGPIGFGASIYLLSEANGPLFQVATLTGFEPVAPNREHQSEQSAVKSRGGLFLLYPSPQDFCTSSPAIRSYCLKKLVPAKQTMLPKFVAWKQSHLDVLLH